MTKKISKMKSAHSFNVLIWSRKYYGDNTKNKREIPLWSGQVVNNKTKINKKFHRASQLLKILEDFYFEEEKKK